jgi:hypothetical protein
MNTKKEQGRIGIHGWLQGRLGVSAAGRDTSNPNNRKYDTKMLRSARTLFHLHMP